MSDGKMPDNSSTVTLQDGRPRGTFLEVLLVFLRLGCTSFGGPIAHLGYFQKEFVARRKWCGAGAMAEIIALAQSLPGPASSQVGFSLGILRAGWLGGLAAWIGFTLPSALLMLAFAYGHSLLGGSAGVGLLHGLQVVAVAVVAQAVLSMQRSLAPDWTRLALAFLAACAALILPAQVATLCAIALGAVLGLLLFGSIKSETSAPIEMRLPKAAGIASAVVFLALLIVVPLLARALAVAWLSVFSAFYRSGALVFGGGHVVLPLLESAVVAPGWVSQQSFLAGYGAAQALPGPLFAFSAYLGAAVRPSPSPPLYGLMSLLGLFAPGLLAVTAVLPFWSELRGSRIMQAALRGINASVVGILAAALIHPLWTSTIHTAGDLAIALVAFALLVLAKVQPWIVVVSVAIFTLLMTLV